ncbi:hypothetical protein D1007_52302 [Hordeum vulgare]|nr:hypothetical protein D1007_52302 [Hordeum vulgare]
MAALAVPFISILFFSVCYRRSLASSPRVLSHYQIHTRHPDPSSLVLLSAFAFLCVAFVGVTPSVALLHHFFYFELVSVEQCSGCASLKTIGASVPGALDAKLLPKAEGFQR